MKLGWQDPGVTQKRLNEDIISYIIRQRQGKSNRVCTWPSQKRKTRTEREVKDINDNVSWKKNQQKIVENECLTEATDECPLEQMGDTWKLLQGTKPPGLQTCTLSGSTELMGQDYKNSTLPSTPCGAATGYSEANPAFMPTASSFSLKEDEWVSKYFWKLT